MVAVLDDIIEAVSLEGPDPLQPTLYTNVTYTCRTYNSLIIWKIISGEQIGLQRDMYEAIQIYIPPPTENFSRIAITVRPNINFTIQCSRNNSNSSGPHTVIQYAVG